MFLIPSLYSTAGIAARLLALRPGMKPFEVKTLLYWLFQSTQSRRP